MEDPLDYNAYIEGMRAVQYPMLKDTVYLDHAGTTLYSKSLMDRFTANMMANLYGNPHSASPASQRATQQVDDTRLRLLQFLNADPDHFDVVFVANATAAIKLVGDSFRDLEHGFWYRYHKDAHTSLVGVRELAKEHVCLGSDEETELWLRETLPAAAQVEQNGLGLFAFPAQSNMDGRRLPLEWCAAGRQTHRDEYQRLFTLLDAAALLSTSPLDLSKPDTAPDFTALSLYKIFGFPDLGALVVRKDAGWVLASRKYFGGGTVDMVLSLKEQWHARKTRSFHEQLEDGTLPVHSIVALDSAMTAHRELFDSLGRVSRHTAFLANRLYDGLRQLKHGNGNAVAHIYNARRSCYSDVKTQGPVVAFNLRDSKNAWVSTNDVEKLASIKNINIRTGSLCNPGGIASALELAPWEMRDNFSAGQRCNTENDIMNGKPTGMIRASLGAMSTLEDVERFISFVAEFFVDTNASRPTDSSPPLVAITCPTPLYVESLTVYPIKSCAGWAIPYDTSWSIRPEGLAWDREWCVVHQGTGMALSQKKYPRMALIRPSLDLAKGVLRIRALAPSDSTATEVEVPLSADPRLFSSSHPTKQCSTEICGDIIDAKAYVSRDISEFLSSVIGVPCQLARFPAATATSPSMRHSKSHLPGQRRPGVVRPILLSNESPILTISRSSLNRLNEIIKASQGKAASPSAFRANIVVAESPSFPPGSETPYAEDRWSHMKIGQETFAFLGGCRRCQMVCVDQVTAEKNQEPFVTLAKTRRSAGKVMFGVHTCHLPNTQGDAHCPTIKVGDTVETFGAGGGCSEIIV